MRVFVIPSWYPSKANPNNGSFFREQSQALLGKEIDVVLLNGTFRSRKSYFAPDNFKLIKFNDRGLKTYQYVTPNFMLSRNAKVGVFLANKNISKIFSAAVSDMGFPNIIHAHSFYPAGYIACVLGKKHNIPVVVLEHSSRVLTKSLSKKHVGYLRVVVDNSDAFLCVSQKLIDSVEELTGVSNKVGLLPNMVSDNFRFYNKKDKNHRFVFLSVGNLIKSKRHDILIDAFSKAFSKDENVELRIVGGGLERKSLEKRVKDLHRDAQIIFTGQLSRDSVVNEMQKADVFVLASEFETFGVVYIEAMACGNPVITYKNGGSDNLIDEYNGILLKDNSPDCFCAAMQEIRGSIDTYNRCEISRRCISKYGSDAYYSKLYSLYRGLIGNAEVEYE